MIDARGLSCPLPVLKVKQAIDASSPSRLEVLVDNATAVGNVERFARNAGYQVAITDLEEDEFSLVLTK